MLDNPTVNQCSVPSVSDSHVLPSAGAENAACFTVDVSAHFTFSLDEASDVLLQFEAAHLHDQQVETHYCTVAGDTAPPRISAQDGVGERIWLNAVGDCAVEYRARVTVQREVAPLAGLAHIAPHDLPEDAVQYLFDSRYCLGTEFSSFVAETFGELSGGALVAAMQQWVASNIRYERGSSTAQTTALDSFNDQRGVCRDFAHVIIAMARAADIPARYVSLYDPGVTPQDFHAVAEVMLADPAKDHAPAWHMVDATGMASAQHTVKIGVGRDAADVSFMTVFGFSDFKTLQVSATLQS